MSQKFTLHPNTSFSAIERDRRLAASKNKKTGRQPLMDYPFAKMKVGDLVVFTPELTALSKSTIARAASRIGQQMNRVYTGKTLFTGEYAVRRVG